MRWVTLSNVVLQGNMTVEEQGSLLVCTNWLQISHLLIAMSIININCVDSHLSSNCSQTIEFHELACLLY